MKEVTPVRFSVVTPNYNMGPLLAETIESVLRNLEPGDEYFVIDGGSTDGSVGVLRRFESRLTGWISEPDSGYAEALAKGFRRCSGDMMCWLNSGDLLLPGALALARRELKRARADLIFGDDLYVDEESRVIFRSSGRVRSLRRMMLYGAWTPLQDACFWTRELYGRIGGIDSKLKYAADYDFFLRAAVVSNCEYVPRIFSAFRRHSLQKSKVTALEYRREAAAVRRRTLLELGVPRLTRVCADSYYWALVRWRHHVWRRFVRQDLAPGTPVWDLPAV